MKRRREGDEEESQVIWLTPDDITMVRDLVSSEGESYEPVLRIIVTNVGQGFGSRGQVPIDEVTINSALGLTTGFEHTEETVLESPRASYEDSYESSAEEDHGEEEFSEEELGEEFDEDALYIEQTAAEIADGALDGLLDEVIGEISAECSVDPQVVRWTITDDAGFMGSLEEARNAAIADAREQISNLLQDPEMVEEV